MDSTLTHSGWANIDEVLARRHVTQCLSVGFVLADDEHGIVLAAGIHGEEAFGVTHIPQQAIVRKKRLR